MNPYDDMTLHISPRSGEVVVEQRIEGGVVSRKTIPADTLADCFLTSRYDDESHPTGLLPEGCIGATMTPKYTYYYIRYPDLRVDFSYFGTLYPNFPIPRLVFCFKYMPQEKKVAECYVCVTKDERLTADTPLYHYPFSNVYNDLRICTGNNALPIYKDPARLHTLASYLLRLPNNNDLYSREHNKLRAEYRDLLEQMKGKEPSLYYTDVLIKSGQTLKQFMDRRR